MPVQIGNKAATFSDPTGLMSDCHRRIEMFLGVLKAAAELGGRRLTDAERRALGTALRYFREAAPKHNADEEDSLFPRLRQVTSPDIQSVLQQLSELEQEHRWAAPLHAELDRLGEQWLRTGDLREDEARAFHAAADRLAAMYEHHIDFEDRVLFPLAARVLPERQKAAIATEMAARRQLDETQHATSAVCSPPRG